MNSREIEDMKALLRRMQIEDPAFRVFGARQHHYLLGPTLTEPELLAFEQQHRVRLPSDYRVFLAEAGNGGLGPDSALFMGKSGAGPLYGLLTLGDAAEDCTLSQPFPFTEATEALPEEVVWAEMDSDLFPGVLGALALCHGGSGLVYYLVVNGPAYGTIWQGRENFYPIAESFSIWYGDWLRRLEEHALPRLANERKIAGVKVGMAKAEVIAICGVEWEQKPRLEKTTLLTFKHLSTQFELNEQDVVVWIFSHSIYC